jgi:feruloyl-CoA synthase
VKDATTTETSVKQKILADGGRLLCSTIALEPFPFRLTERLKHWATVAPDQVFIGRKNEGGTWDTLTYAETFEKVRCIAQALLHRNVSVDRPLAILSENGIEHALISLAALHVGIPYSPISPAYSLRSTDFEKLRHVIRLLTPGLIFVSDARKYQKALHAVAKEIEVVCCVAPQGDFTFLSFDDWLGTAPTHKVDEAFQNIAPNTIAKILFTSGSTGIPKGVINTHENISANWQQITQSIPLAAELGLTILDWLPWHHTFGGNHNFGVALFNGGSFYIDDGSPQDLPATVANLKEITPTIYFNVPKGFHGLIPFFKNDPLLRDNFFWGVRMLFYAGASISQQDWDAWQELSLQTVGRRITIGAGLGSTETSPATLISNVPDGFAGLLGLPLPGLELKLTPVSGKLEARYRGKNIFQGYWRQPELTKHAFDDEGFFCSGDALRLADENDIDKGLVFDGRTTEDFKLSTGTWVNVGVLRSRLIAAGEGLIHDAVITGHDKDFVGAIIFPGLDYCRNLTGLTNEVALDKLTAHPAMQQKLDVVLNALARQSTGSSTLIKKAVFADFTLNMDNGEITDKGSINQRTVIQNHHDIVMKIYEDGE